MKLRSLLVALCFCLAPAGLVAQSTGTSIQPAAGLPSTINVFLDCSYMCDFDFVRTEIPYVNWVRDRADADVHLLITAQSTGGGGMEMVLNFIGLRAFAQSADTLKYVSSVDATADDRRKGYTRVIKAGLVRYLARTAAADRLVVSLAPVSQTAAPAAASARDPWHAWVLSLSANANVNGEKTYKGLYGWSEFSANRTTE